MHSSKELLTESSKSPDEAKMMLKSKVKEAGGNSVVDFRYSKRTGSSGNYRYSIHQFFGKPSFILETKKVSDKKLIQTKESFESQLEMFKKKSELITSEVENDSLLGVVKFVFVVFLAVFLFFGVFR